MSTCPLCDTEVKPHEVAEGQTVSTEQGPLRAHRECLLRSVLGGIGHLTDHHYWCYERNDPNAGLSYRHSALLVDQWVQVHGMPVV